MIEMKGGVFMWTRKELKERGKAAFYRNYWMTVLVTFVLGILTSGFNSGRSAGGTIKNTFLESGGSITDAIGTMGAMFLTLSILFIFVWGIVLLIVRVFIRNLFEIGCMRFYEENSEGKAPFGLVVEGFRSGQYGKNVLTLFLRDLYTFFWSLLLIIPGIIKVYQYSMIPYILAENPMISRKRAFELSKQMMSGQIGGAIVLDLSYIGWAILGGITFNIVNILFTNPYRQSAWVELYKVNRQRVLDSGEASYQELPGFTREYN